MTKYNRITGKVFGENATATGDNPEIGQFGSAQAGSYIGTTDVKTIQALPAWQKGWVGAVTPETNFPPLPEMTGAMKVLSQQQCYLLQQGLAEWDNTTIYYKNNFSSKNGKIYISQSDENQGNDPETDTTNWKEFTSGGLPIGTVFPLFCTANYVPEGALPCNGSEYAKSMFVDFYTNFLVGGLLSTCTYEQYANEISTYGQCGKFALDTTNEKFKVPTIKDGAYITQALSDTELGKVYNESLPNIKGEIHPISDGFAEGAFETDSSVQAFISGAASNNVHTVTSFDASRSSSIYQDNAKVQGDNIRMRYFIQVANGQINSSQMNWSEWTSSLAGKANVDLTNLSNEGKALVGGLAFPSEIYIDLTLNASGSTYTAPADGYYYVSKRSAANSVGQAVSLSKMVGGQILYSYYFSAGTGTQSIAGLIPAFKGDTVRIGYTATGATDAFRFFYSAGSEPTT